MNRATILIPTTGAAVVRQAIESCLAQSYGNLQVLAVVDGSQHADEFARNTTALSDARLQSVILPENVGAADCRDERKRARHKRSQIFIEEETECLRKKSAGPSRAHHPIPSRGPGG